jgi:hypothetical protein
MFDGCSPSAAAGTSVDQGAHHLPRLLVAEAEIDRLQASPAGLLLGQRQALGLADDLADAGVAEMTARTSPGDGPCGGCQRLASDRTERSVVLESDSSPAP